MVESVFEVSQPVTPDLLRTPALRREPRPPTQVLLEVPTATMQTHTVSEMFTAKLKNGSPRKDPDVAEPW